MTWLDGFNGIVYIQHIYMIKHNKKKLSVGEY